MRAPQSEDFPEDNFSGMPQPEDFGLPTTYTENDAGKEITLAHRRAKQASALLFWMPVAVVGLAAYLFLEREAIIWVWFAFILYVAIFLSQIKDRFELSFMRANADAAGAAAFYLARSEWRESNAETGFRYWSEKRGRAFEEAVARFFGKRGWTVETTPVTGDGGVDLILSRGALVYWCQCKGHAKAVPVSEIRRIAGASIKSGGRASPALISANGFTQPALVEARSLKVVCIDGLKLTQLALSGDIADLPTH